jgi:HEAT repeat protein
MPAAHKTRNRVLLTGGIFLLALAVMARADLGAQSQPQAAARIATLDEILKEVSSYDGGIDSAALWKLRDYVYARKDDPAGRAQCERKLLQFLKTSATPVAKMAACRYLRVIGSDAAVPALQAMLSDPGAADMAIYALQQIPGGTAEKALLQSLSTTNPATRNAVIAALGARQAAAAVPALALLLQQPASAAPATLALGSIGGDAACKALVAAYQGATADLKAAVARSIMMCAEQQLAGKNASAALALYEPLASDRSLPVPVRKAATMGRIASAGSGAPAIVLDLLGGTDTDLQEAAIAKIADVVAPGAIAPVCSLLPRLPVPAQVQLLPVVARYPRDLVLSTVLEAARSSAVPVRIAALKALESTGDPASVPFLAETAASARGPEQAAARAALGALKGREVDEAILALLARQPPDDVAGELLLALADRRVYPAKPVVAGALTSTSLRVRTQALRALRTIGTPSDVPAVLDLLLKSTDETEQAEAETTIVGLTQKIAGSDRRSDVVTARLATVKTPEERVRLIKVLPQIGDSRALPILRAALAGDNPDVFDAAVRAFAAWPTSSARDDVLRLARDLRNETQRLLAIRALIRIIGLDKYRDPDSAVADLRLAAGFSWRPDEQKLVLGALAEFPCQDALDLAKGFLQEASVAAEAQVAIDNITEHLQKEAIRK